MPTRNRAAKALRAARSVLDQDVALELVIVDDSSDDDTAQALEDLRSKDRRVRVVRTTGGPVGPCVARNQGLAVASGDLVGFCDDDDEWLPGAGRALLDHLAADASVVVVSAWHVVAQVDLGTRAVFRGPLAYGTRALLWQNFVAVPFAVIRRAALPFEVSFDPMLPTGEDWDLWLRCSEHGLVRTLPEVFYTYSQHGGERVTRVAESQIAGRRGFLDKHGPAMTPACRLYHEAVLAGYEGGRRAMVAHVAAAARRAPADGALVLGLLASSTLSSRRGLRRGDPGRQARLMARLLRRAEGSGPDAVTAEQRPHGH